MGVLRTLDSGFGFVLIEKILIRLSKTFPRPQDAHFSDGYFQYPGFPPEKRFHRFFPMEPEDFQFPSDRTERYLILEISMMEGRTPETKKKLIHLLFNRIEAELGIAPADVEITLFESPKCNWGFRGQTGDEIVLNYKTEI